MIMFGGWTGSSRLNDVHVLDLCNEVNSEKIEVLQDTQTIISEKVEDLEGKHALPPSIKFKKEVDVDFGGYRRYSAGMLPNGTVIVEGGAKFLDGHGPIGGDTLAIDVKTGVSRRLPDGPHQYYHHAYVFVETWYCTFRGYRNSWGNKNQPACLNMDTQEWVEAETTGDVGPNTDEAWIGQAVTQVNETHGLVCNGQNLYTYPETCQYLQLIQQDPLKLKWTNIDAKGDVPEGRSNAALVSLNNGSVLMVGGGIYSNNKWESIYGDMHRLDPYTANWSRVIPKSSESPPKVACHAMVKYNFNGKQYVFLYGGSTENKQTLMDMWMFDVLATTWHKVLTGFGRSVDGMVLLKNYIYVLPGLTCIGIGCQKKETEQTIQVFELEPDLEMTQNELEELREETEDLKEEVDVLSKMVSHYQMG